MKQSWGCVSCQTDHRTVPCVHSFACRPLFVAEAEFRAGKVFTRSKKGMLALYGTDLHVVDVLGLEAADVASGVPGGGADVTSCVLRWVNYMNVSGASGRCLQQAASNRGQRSGNTPHPVHCHAWPGVAHILPVCWGHAAAAKAGSPPTSAPPPPPWHKSHLCPPHCSLLSPLILRMQLLDVSFTGPATLRVEHTDTSDKAKIRGAADTSLPAASEEEPYAPGPSLGGASIASSAAPGPSSGSGSSASIRVTSESFTLTFRDAGVAQRAAAALLFQQAQYAAVRHWLRTGLHAGFRCDLITVRALPLMYDDHSSSLTSASSRPGGGLARSHSLLPAHVLYSCASGSYSRASVSGSGAGSGAAAIAASAAAGAGAGGAGSTAAAAAAVPYPWGDVDAQDWGCSVPLPAGWGALLDAAAGEGAGMHMDEDEPGVTPEELTVPVVLEQGPKAVQVRCRECRCATWWRAGYMLGPRQQQHPVHPVLGLQAVEGWCSKHRQHCHGPAVYVVPSGAFCAVCQHKCC